MSKCYQNRLDKLENELQVLLMLHCACVNMDDKEDSKSGGSQSSVAEEGMQPNVEVIKCPFKKSESTMTTKKHWKVCVPQLSKDPSKNSRTENPNSSFDQRKENAERKRNGSASTRELDGEDTEPDRMSINDLVRLVEPEKDLTGSSKNNHRGSPECAPLCQGLMDNVPVRSFRCHPACPGPADDPPQTCYPAYKGPCNDLACVPPGLMCKQVRSPDYKPCQDVVACKFDYAIEQLRQERAQFKALQTQNNKLRNLIGSNHATIREAVEAKGTALNLAHHLKERVEQLHNENRLMTERLAKITEEKAQMGDATQALEAKVSALKQMSQRSMEDVNTMRNAGIKAEALEKRVQDAESKAEGLITKLKEEMRRRMEEENALACTVRNAERRLLERDSEARQAEQQAREAEKRLEESQLKKEELEQQVRDMDVSLKQEIIRRQSMDESAQKEIGRCGEKIHELTNRLHDLERSKQGIEDELHNARREAQKKCAEQEEELRAFKMASFEKESVSEKKRADLARLLRELAEAAKAEKARADQLLEANKEHEAFIHSQQQGLINKEEQVRLAHEEVENVRRKSADLDRQVRNLRISVEAMERLSQENNLEEVQEELRQTRMALEIEKDKLLIKDKIIEDQTGTIKQLKAQLQERNDEHRQNCRDIEQQVLAEQQRVKELTLQLERTDWAKQELENRLAELEEESKENEKRTQDLSRHDHLLCQLELQVEAKQKEWDLQMKLLAKDKEQASNAAQYATQKMTALEEEISTHKKVQRMMSLVLKEKTIALEERSEMLRAANERLKQLSRSFFQNAPLTLDCECYEPVYIPCPKWRRKPPEPSDEESQWIAPNQRVRQGGYPY